MLAVLPWLAHAADAFLEPDQAFSLDVDTTDAKSGVVRLHWSIAPGYYLYRDRIQVKAVPSSTELGAVTKPAGDRKEDANFGVTEVYHKAVTVDVAHAGAHALQVTWQGCAEAGLCYPAQVRQVNLPSTGGGIASSALDNPSAASMLAAVNDSDSRITQLIGEQSLAWTVPLFFVFGIALAFTPCVLPMVPIVSGIVVGSGTSQRRRALTLSLAFVLPMALTYALLGAIAARAGANVQALLQNRWTLGAFGGVFVLLSLAMFGFYELQLPAFLRDRLDSASRRRQGGTLVGAGGMGVLSALLVGPCMTAPLAGTLIYIAQTGKVASGALLLFALGLGMGTPLLVIGTLGARCLPRPGPWMDRVKGAFGFLLLATAISMVQRVVSPTPALAMWGAWLGGLALTLFHLSSGASPGGRAGARLLLRSGALMAGLWGSAMVLGATAGGTDPWRPLGVVVASTGDASAQVGSAVRAAEPSTASAFETFTRPQALQARLDAARAAGQPVLLDFSADWCVSCKTLDREVFADPRVRQALAGVTLLRADVTAGDADQQSLMRSLQVLGPPTALLFDARGQERRDARLVGEFGVADLLQRLPARTQASGSPS